MLALPSMPLCSCWLKPWNKGIGSWYIRPNCCSVLTAHAGSKYKDKLGYMHTTGTLQAHLPYYFRLGSLKVLGHGHVFKVWILISSGSDIIIQIRTRGFGVI